MQPEQGLAIGDEVADVGNELDHPVGGAGQAHEAGEADRQDGAGRAFVQDDPDR